MLGFHHVGIDGPLAEQLYLAQLLRLRLEHPDKLFAYNLALALRVSHAALPGGRNGKPGEKAIRRAVSP